MITKKDILQTRDDVRNEALNVLRKSIESALNEWLDAEAQGCKRQKVVVSIPLILEGKLPEEIRTELADAGYKCELLQGVLSIS